MVEIADAGVAYAGCVTVEILGMFTVVVQVATDVARFADVVESIQQGLEDDATVVAGGDIGVVFGIHCICVL